MGSRVSTLLAHTKDLSFSHRLLSHWGEASVEDQDCLDPAIVEDQELPFSISQGKRKGEQQNEDWFRWMILATGGGGGSRWDGGSGITSPTQEHWLLATHNVAKG